MKLKTILKWLRLNYIIVAFALSLALISYFVFSLSFWNFYQKPKVFTDKKVELVQNNIPEVQVDSGLPVHIKIPKINVDAVIESVGLTSDGAVDVPKKPSNAAWYNLGPFPGAEGSSVITGHYGLWKDGSKSVFDNLNKLSEGDVIYIEDEKEMKTTFAVREIRKYNPDDIVEDVFISNDGKAHLNLITCEGIWNENTKSYSERLVVFADKK